MSGNLRCRNFLRGGVVFLPRESGQTSDGFRRAGVMCLARESGQMSGNFRRAGVVFPATRV